MVNPGEAPMSFADQALKVEILQIQEKLLPILKSLANEHRLQLLITLLDGESAFQTLLHAVPIKKTALANHLTQLLEARLMKKVNYGTYAITEDGKEYLRNLHHTWRESLVAKEEEMESLDSRKNTTSFIKSYFQSH